MLPNEPTTTVIAGAQAKHVADAKLEIELFLSHDDYLRLTIEWCVHTKRLHPFVLHVEGERSEPDKQAGLERRKGVYV